MTDLPTTRSPSRIPGVEAFRRGRQLMQEAPTDASTAESPARSSIDASASPLATRTRSTRWTPSATSTPSTHSAVGPILSDHAVVLRKIELSLTPTEEEEVDHGPELPASVVRAFTATFLVALVGLLLAKSPVLV